MTVLREKKKQEKEGIEQQPALNLHPQLPKYDVRQFWKFDFKDTDNNHLR